MSNPSSTSRRGYFEIGIYQPKTAVNVGTLWRSAFQLGAAGIFTIGRRFPQQASDTVKAYRHVPMREFDAFDDFYRQIPTGARLVGIEMGGKPLGEAVHPDAAIYLLGAEDKGLPYEVKKRCHQLISLEADRSESYNVAVAGSLVLYHRQFLAGRGRGITGKAAPSLTERGGLSLVTANGGSADSPFSLAGNG